LDTTQDVAESRYGVFGVIAERRSSLASKASEAETPKAAAA
jgi:hypothetical protein